MYMRAALDEHGCRTRAARRILERHKTEAVQHRDSEPRWASLCPEDTSLRTPAICHSLPGFDSWIEYSLFGRCLRLHIPRASRLNIAHTPLRHPSAVLRLLVCCSPAWSEPRWRGHAPFTGRTVWLYSLGGGSLRLQMHARCPGKGAVFLPGPETGLGVSHGPYAPSYPAWSLLAFARQLLVFLRSGEGAAELEAASGNERIPLDEV